MRMICSDCFVSYRFFFFFFLTHHCELDAFIKQNVPECSDGHQKKKKKAVLSETHIFNFIYEQTAQEQAQIPLWDHYYYYYYHDCTKVTYIKYP